MSSRDEIWFPAQRYGWGWGLPRRWQGWVVLLIYFGLLAVGVRSIDAHTRLAEFLSYMLMLNAALIWICWRKGEPPRWRWGGD